MTLNPTELALIDRWQRNFPLVERPFTIVGQSLGLNETATIEIFQRLREAGVVSRIGAVVRPHTVGASTLAAMRVPAERLDAVAAIVTGQPAVNHNYQRAHAFNLWFVIAGPDSEAVAATIRRIEEESELRVLNLPLLRSYHIDLGFSLAENHSTARSDARPAGGYWSDPFDRSLLGAIEAGLPIVARPYRDVAEVLGVDEEEVRSRLRQLAISGIINRFGCVVRHRALGYIANAMAVWDMADDLVDDIGHRFARNPNVTLCYRRPRVLPDWPYNLFCMVHAKTKRDAFAVIDDLNLIADAEVGKQAVLFSTRCFKQRGATFSNQTEGLH